MTLLFMDSVDHYAGADAPDKWQTASADVSPSYGRNGTNGWRVASAAAVVQQLVGDRQVLYAGRYFKLPNAPYARSEAIGFYDGRTAQMKLRQDPETLALQVLRGDTVLATHDRYIAYGEAAYLEFGCKIDSADGWYEVRQNGITVLSANGVNTRSSANNSANIVRFGEVNAHCDDMYICDDQGAVNNTFLGDVRAVAHLPNGAGTYSDWTPSAGSNYENVDDATPDDDTTYNITDVTDARDSFTLTNTPVGVGGACKGIQVLISCRKDDAGSRAIVPFLRIGGVNYEGTPQGVGDTYVYHVRQIWELNPATEAPWTLSDINALEVGYRLVS